MRHIKKVMSALVLLAFFIPSVYASMITVKTMDSLTKESNIIFRGVCIETENALEGRAAFIKSVFRVSEVIKDEIGLVKTGQRIEIPVFLGFTVRHGKADAAKSSSEKSAPSVARPSVNQFKFQKDSEYIIFAHATSKDGQIHISRVTGVDQGVFVVKGSAVKSPHMKTLLGSDAMKASSLSKALGGKPVTTDEVDLKTFTAIVKSLK